VVSWHNNTQLHGVWPKYIKTKIKNEATHSLSEIEFRHILRRHRFLRKLEKSHWAFSKLCCNEMQNQSLPKSQIYYARSVIKSRLSRINISSDWARNLEYVPIPTQKRDPSPKHVLIWVHENLSGRTWYSYLIWNWQRRTWTGQHSTCLTGWLGNSGPRLKRQEIWILLQMQQFSSIWWGTFG
jgi:hypothetical protein